MKSFKTGTLGSVAVGLVRQRIHAGMLTLEMGDERVLERIIAAHNGINAIRFRKRENPDNLRAHGNGIRKRSFAKCRSGSGTSPAARSLASRRSASKRCARSGSR